MTDSSRYKGHTPAEEWGDIVYADGYRSIFLDDDVYATDTDCRLMADAPLLLEDLKKLQKMYAHSMEERLLLREEVKRLRELIKEIAQHDAKEYWSYELLQKVEMIE